LPGYFWIFPLGGGRANVGVSILAYVLKRRGLRLKDLLETCVRHPRFRDRFTNARRTGSTKGWGLPLGSRPRQMAGDGWMLIGDAARLIDPFTGEGIGNAMVSGESAARVAVEAHRSGDFSMAALQQHGDQVLAKLQGELKLSHVFQILARSQAMLDFVFRKASRSPEMGEMMNGMFDDVELRKKLASPLFYLRLLAA
jgi:flavin-dependent dehydrogenase